MSFPLANLLTLTHLALLMELKILFCAIYSCDTLSQNKALHIWPMSSQPLQIHKKQEHCTVMVGGTAQREYVKAL